MTPELETLDQLLGGDLSLAIVRQLYSDDEAFKRGVWLFSLAVTFAF